MDLWAKKSSCEPAIVVQYRAKMYIKGLNSPTGKAGAEKSAIVLSWH